MTTTSTVSNGQTSGGLVANAGTIIEVLSGGTIDAAMINAGGSAVISVGGVDAGSTIAAGGAELVYGSALNDVIAGSQTVSTGTSNGYVANEVILNGGVVYLSVKSTSAFDMTVDGGGALDINGNISATDVTLGGGTVDLESAKATLTGSLVFGGGGTLLVTGNTSAGSGDLAVISGFAAGDVIDLTAATSIGAGSATLTTSTSGGDTVATVSGGGLSNTYTFAGTALNGGLALVSDDAGGQEIIVSAAAAVTSVGAGSSVSNVTVSAGSPLTVYAGGTIVDTTILAGGSVTVSSGGTDSAASIAAGGSETVFGSAFGDTVAGAQTLGAGTAVASGETIQNGGSVTLGAAGATLSGATVAAGGTLTLSGGGIASDVTDAGGTVILDTAADTLAGSFTFNGAGTLDIAALSIGGAGDQAVISGFYSGDVINITPLGAGATLSTTTSGGNTVATVTSGGASETLIFAGTVASNLTLETVAGVAQIDYAAPPTTTTYTPGDLVLSVYGDGSDTGSYSLDQAAPITLEEITTSGSVVSTEELPQTTTIVNGTTEYAISGEYQSASEGLLTLSGDGESLVILGYGVTAAAFDASDAATVYGTAALGQTASILVGQYTAVARVVADISYNGSVDTSTALYDIFNTNNPRSVYTIDGTTFYLSGQGNGTDGTEGVFVAYDGASSATPIYNTTTDTREVAIYNNQLLVSVDSKLNGGGGLYNFGTTLPTTPTTPTVLPGIGSSIVLTAAEANSVNSADIGESVNLSPEQYFFASPAVLYIADGGDPKEGGLGDGGLQKWSLVGNTWTLDYTLSLGLNQVPDTDTDGTTGLIGLTGTVIGGEVILYATNETAAETDQTYLYSITDPLDASAAPAGESFTLLDTAAPDTLIRGVAFAPTSGSTTPVVSTLVTVASGVVSAGLTIAAGGTIVVQNGGTTIGITLLSGGSATVSSGGVDSGTFIAHGASETLAGAASFDIVDGVQLVSDATAVVTSEVVENGGSLNLFLAGATADATTVNAGGGLYISGHAEAVNTVISGGGTVVLESPKATLSGTLDFVGSGGTLAETVVVSATASGYGDLAAISGFGSGDVIDEGAFVGTLTTAVNGGTVIATITSGSKAESFTFVGSGGVTGTAYAAGLSVVNDAGSGVDLIYTPPPPVDIVVSSAITSSGLSITSGNAIKVLNGGTMSAITVSNGGSAVISNGGEDLGSTILAGGTETVSGDANGDQIYGLQIVTSGPSGATLPATVENETVYAGGTVELYLKPDIGTDITVQNGGSLLLSGNVSAVSTTLEAGAYLALQSPKAVISGGLVFAGSATAQITDTTSSGFGGSGAVISGWQAGDVIDETLISPSVAGLTTTTSGGNTVETITGGTYPDVFVFLGTAVASDIILQDDPTGGVELAYVPCFARGTRLATPAGAAAVESLRVGDMVRSHLRGTAAPVRWIGQRHIDCARLADPAKLHPVVIRADAFGPGRPGRDLWLSADHAIYADGALIPVRVLVDGRSIVRQPVASVTYFHVELDAHDVLLAEGLPVESFLDTGNRRAFTGGKVTTLAPDFSARVWEAEGCAPLHLTGPVVDGVRAALAARAAARGAASAVVRVTAWPAA